MSVETNSLQSRARPEGECDSPVRSSYGAGRPGSLTVRRRCRAPNSGTRGCTMLVVSTRSETSSTESAQARSGDRSQRGTRPERAAPAPGPSSLRGI
eukprot:436950-Alexandrium_andersonii.AAC.1